MTRLVTQAQQRDAVGTSPSLAREFAASGISVGVANTVLNPVEVIKTRMQLSGASAAAPARGAAAAAAPAGFALPGPGASLLSSRCLHSTVPAAGSIAQQSLNPSAHRALLLPWPAGGSAAAAAAADVAAPAEALAASMRAAAASSSSSSASSAAAVAAPAAAARRPGFFATAGLIFRQEGLGAFTRGIQASATRAVLNGGIRLGLYDPIKTLMSADGSGRDLHMGQKLAAGSISGCIGAVLTTPIELAKTRLQAPSAGTRSMRAVLQGVVAQRGVLGLWSGATPSVLRLIMLNGSMVATYDEVKGRIMRLTGLGPGLPLVLASSCVAGLVTTTAINPADVIRAYMQTGRGSSLLGVARHILEREGPRGFLKGWTAAYARTGPQTLIIFTTSELVRPLFGLKAIGSG